MVGTAGPFTSSLPETKREGVDPFRSWLEHFSVDGHQLHLQGNAMELDFQTVLNQRQLQLLPRHIHRRQPEAPHLARGWPCRRSSASYPQLRCLRNLSLPLVGEQRPKLREIHRRVRGCSRRNNLSNCRHHAQSQAAASRDPPRAPAPSPLRPRAAGPKDGSAAAPP